MENTLKIIFIIFCIIMQQMQISHLQEKIDHLIEMIEYVNEMEINNSERIYYIEDQMEMGQ